MKILKYTLMLGIGGLFFWLAFRNQDWGQLKKDIAEANYTYISLAVICMVLSHITRAVRWNMLLQPLGFRVSVFNGSLAVFSGYLANLAIPRLGEVTRCTVLTRTDNVPFTEGFGTVITERVIDVLALFIILILDLILEFDRIMGFFKEFVLTPLQQKVNGLGNLFTGAKGFLFIAIGVVFIVALYFLIRKFSQSALFKKLTGFIKGFWLGLISVARMKRAWLFVLYTVLLQTLYYLPVLLCFYAIGATGQLGALAALSVFVMGSFAYAMPVQAGAPYIVMVSTLLISVYGITTAGAGAYAGVVYAFQTMVIIFFGGLSFLLISLIHPKPQPENEDKLVAQNQAEAV